jgi:flavodoxin
MKALVVYDSVFGNTEKVAQAMGQALASHGEVQTLRVGDVKPEHLIGVDIVVVGSPTRAFSPTPAVTKWLKGLAANSLKGVKVTAFDTRVDVEIVESKVLLGMVKVFGYAAKPMGDRMIKKGGDLQMEPEGFFVLGTEGPLKEGELERAANWVQQLL